MKHTTKMTFLGLVLVGTVALLLMWPKRENLTEKESEELRLDLYRKTMRMNVYKWLGFNPFLRKDLFGFHHIEFEPVVKEVASLAEANAYADSVINKIKGLNPLLQKHLKVAMPLPVLEDFNKDTKKLMHISREFAMKNKLKAIPQEMATVSLKY